MTEARPPRATWRLTRLLLAAAAGLTAICAALWIGLASGPETRPEPPVKPAAPEASRNLPGFDIVRVNPTGDAVIAGHASPGAEVRIEEGGHEIGRALADRGGQWVFVPSQPLAPGARALTLTERAQDGQERRSEGSVLLAVPARGQAEPPLAVLSQPGSAPPRLLQSSPAQSGAPTIDAAEYDEHGALRLAGRAGAGASVRVYLDEKPFGDARADPEGRWTLAPAEPLVSGEHRLRVDEVGQDGRVIARVEVPLQRASLEPSALADGRLVVHRGETLWQIARNAYGKGMRYTVLYAANRDQIRDPDRIYPGQNFAIPAMRGPAAMPTAHTD